VAAGDDPGLEIARQITEKPVVGIAEAGMLFACALGAKFALFTALRCEAPKAVELAAKYGLTSRLAGVLTLEDAGEESLTSFAVISDPARLFERFDVEASRAVREDMAEVIVLISSVMCVLAEPLTKRVGVPVVSGVACGLKLAESLVELGLKTSHIYKYHTPAKEDRLIGYEDLAPFYGKSKGR
jgi:allantoin racemase